MNIDIDIINYCLLENSKNNFQFIENIKNMLNFD